MIRKQVLIREEQKVRLKAAAAKAGRSESALVREAIDRMLAEHGAEPAGEAASDGWKRAILEAAGVWADREDIDEIMAESRAGWDRRFEELMRQWRHRESQDNAA